MSNNLSSATSQKLSKLNLSDSFNSDASELLDTYPEDIYQMIDTLHTTLIRSKVLSKDSCKPAATLSNLNNLITTICDEFLLEIDKPLSKTHCSSDTIALTLNEDCKIQDIYDDSSEDVLTTIFESQSSVKLTEQNCKELCAIILSLSRDSKSVKLKKQVDKLEKKLALYAEEIVKSKALVKIKDREIGSLKGEIKIIKQELLSGKQSPDGFGTPAFSESTDS